MSVFGIFEVTVALLDCNIPSFASKEMATPTGILSHLSCLAAVFNVNLFMLFQHCLHIIFPMKKRMQFESLLVDSILTLYQMHHDFLSHRENVGIYRQRGKTIIMLRPYGNGADILIHGFTTSDHKFSLLSQHCHNIILPLKNKSQLQKILPIDSMLTRCRMAL